MKPGRKPSDDPLKYDWHLPVACVWLPSGQPLRMVGRKIVTELLRSRLATRVPGGCRLHIDPISQIALRGTTEFPASLLLLGESLCFGCLMNDLRFQAIRDSWRGPYHPITFATSIPINSFNL
jgi:hypothetical protein